MAQFEIPESPKFNYLDLNALKGQDSMDIQGDYSRPSKMLNIIKRRGIHQTRYSVIQSCLKLPTAETTDQSYTIKYVGKFEMFDGLNSTPYFIKISEKLGELNLENGSSLCISIYGEPDVGVNAANLETGTYDAYIGLDGGYEITGDSKLYNFTNYGESGDRTGLYTDVEYDGKTWVFTPIGILAFECSHENITEPRIDDIMIFQPDLEATLDKEVFESNVHQTKNYEFYYHATDDKWSLNDINNPEETDYEEISLEDYGIEITEGTPIEGMAFSVSYWAPEDRHILHFDVVNVLDDPYVPTVAIGSNPDGTLFTPYESVNLLTDKRNATFLSDGTSTVYQLPEKHLVDGSASVQIKNDDGVYEQVPEEDYTFNHIDGTVTFTEAPGTSPVDGQDNVKISYSKEGVQNPAETEFNLVSDSSKNLKASTVISNEIVNEKLRISYSTSIGKSENFDSSITAINTCSLQLKLNGIAYATFNLTSTEMASILSGTPITKTGYADIDYSNLKNRDWSEVLTTNFTKSTSSEVLVPGSATAPTSIAAQNGRSSAYTWIGSRTSAKATAVVGINEDGSDSYWNVEYSIQLWVSKKEYLYCNSRDLYGTINGVETKAGTTGTMQGTATLYPSTPRKITQKINYSAALNGGSIKLRSKCNIKATFNGTYCETITDKETRSITLPTITLPTKTGSTSTETITETSNGEYSETIDYNETSYENVVPGGARLACYYGTKYAIVYGYQDDRRIFVSDGTSKDCYSGRPLNGKSSIYYFPDDNYNVLGEDTEIMGYASTDGYLLTFKRGNDSVYVRYSATINGVVGFPVSTVTKNLQILAPPMQIENEVIVLTRNGVEGLVYTNNEARTFLRSYYINNYFYGKVDYDYDHMQWFVEENLLHIFLNDLRINKCYDFVADLNDKSVTRLGSSPTRVSGMSTLQFQYEWYVNEIPVLNVNKQFSPPKIKVYEPRDFEMIDYENNNQIKSKDELNDISLFGYSNESCYELLYESVTSNSLTTGVDRLQKIETTDWMGLWPVTHFYPIKCYFETNFMNFGAINVAKTIRYLYLNVYPRYKERYYIGYKNEEEQEETMDVIYTDLIFKEKTYNYRNNYVIYPKLIQIKSKIKKFMYIKLYIENEAYKNGIDEIPEEEYWETFDKYGAITFDRLLIQYQFSGRYRGE